MLYLYHSAKEIEPPVFYDGYVLIITQQAVCKKYIHPELGELGLTLEEIRKDNPEIIMVIWETYTRGEIWRFDNYGMGEWNQTGETIGFA